MGVLDASIFLVTCVDIGIDLRPRSSVTSQFARRRRCGSTPCRRNKLSSSDSISFTLRDRQSRPDVRAWAKLRRAITARDPSHDRPSVQPPTLGG